RAAAYEHDALLAQASLDSRPVDDARLDLLLDPDLLHPGVRVIRAGALLLEHAVAVTVRAGPALSAPHPARGLRAAHHPAGSVHRRVERLHGILRLHALEDHRLVSHRAADEALLARARRRAALADDPVRAAEVVLEPREVVVVVHLVSRLGAQDLEHLAD